MLQTSRFELSRLEWLNKRGWKNFQDFMVTYGYDAMSAADHMKAEEVLCDYRSSDPFANREEIDAGNDEDGELEELEELEEGGDEMVGMVGLDEGKDGEKQEIISDAMIDVKDVLEGSHDGGDGMEDNNEREYEEEERDEILDLMTDDDHDDDLEDCNEDDRPDGTERDIVELHISAPEQERLESIYGIRCENEGIQEWLIGHGWSRLEDYMEYLGMNHGNDNDVEPVGNSIKGEMRLEVGDIRAGIEEDTEEMDMEDDTRHENERNADREDFISERMIDEEDFPRRKESSNFDGGNLTANLLMTDIAGQIRNSQEIEGWLIEQGYPNLFWFMLGHGLDFYDDELICVVGSQIKTIVENGIQNGLEVLEQGFKGLNAGDNQN
ncbi:99471bb3-3602-4810-87c8-288c27a5f3ee [Sclerotinia trifoliorum]|uniref:99471bb3-3602-4810-87c8-288c27a5f3ee n=1 Tax=Sclerotinia trifoliorum TaxID=28548 RepID=A0A8H2ZWQ1_9HELO|nr:99471bb3-3602-4810-87c8-288c27a5f3ee [Sclerotinia trifoliorum]